MLLAQGTARESTGTALRCRDCGQYLGITTANGPLAQSVTSKHKKRCNGTPVFQYKRAAPLSVFTWGVKMSKGLQRGTA